MSNSVERKNDNVSYTPKVQNQNSQKLWKTTKNLDKGTCKSTTGPIERTAVVTSKSKKVESEPSYKQLEILSVKADNGKVMIEFRAPSTAPSSNSGNYDEEQDGFTEVKDEIEFGETSISVQSMPTTDDDPHYNQTIHGGSTAIKVEDEVDIKMEDEMEFCALSDIDQSISENDDEVHNSQGIQNKLAVTKVDQIGFGEPSISVQLISKAGDEPQKNQTHEVEFCDQLEIDTLITPETTAFEQLAGPEGNKNRPEFVCDICSKQYSKESSMRLHRLRHHGKPKFHCSVCGVVKFFKCELIRHMRTHNTPEEKNKSALMCDICHKPYSSKSSLSEHRLRHGKPNLDCSVCGLTKFTQYEMDRHMKIHDTNRLNFQCDTCPKKFLSQAKLSHHRKSHDATCDICSKRFGSEGSLNKHRLRHGKPDLKCSVCGLAKFTQYEMDRHMRMHDTNPLYFKCDICPKKFSSKSPLNEHRLCHKKQNIDCTVCGVVICSQYEMDTHMRMHVVYFTCEICPKKFLSQAKLSNHRKSHDATCDICSKQCGNEGSLKKHRLRHGGPNLKCSVCGLAKFTQYEMDRHMKTHETNRIKLKCDICPKSFLSQVNLSKHRKTHDASPKYFIGDILSKQYTVKASLKEHLLRHDKPNSECTFCGVTKVTQYELDSVY